MKKETIVSLIAIVVISICFIFMVSMANKEKINTENNSEFTPIVIESGYINYIPYTIIKIKNKYYIMIDGKGITLIDERL